MEVLRGSLHRIVRVLQAAQLHLRFQEAVLLPGRADGRRCPKKSHEFCEGARHGDVVLLRSGRWIPKRSTG